MSSVDQGVDNKDRSWCEYTQKLRTIKEILSYDYCHQIYLEIYFLYVNKF